MNKKLFLGMFAAAGMLFATSCSNDELDQVQSTSEQAQVTFSLATEGSIATRATISDGTKANKLVYAVYKLNAQTGTPELQNVIGSTDGQIVKYDFKSGYEVELTLAKGQTYQVAFWAQHKDCNAYNTADLTAVEVKYKNDEDGTNSKNNDELRDAFFKTVQFEVKGDKNIDVVLQRPFAQINVGVEQTDWNAAVASGIKVLNSDVEINNVANEINLLTGAVNGAETITYDLNTIPNETLYVETDNTKDGKESYVWLSMSYILVNDGSDAQPSIDGAQKSTLNGLKYTFAPEDGNSIEFQEGLAGAPVQRNWRTNILGKILTGDVQFNITIDPAYEGDYIYPEKNEMEEQLKFVATFGGTANMDTDVDLTGEAFEVKADAIFNMNNNKLTVGEDDKWYGFVVSKGTTTVNDANIVTTGAGIKVVDGADMVFNGGNVQVNANTNSGSRYVFYTHGAGTTTTINGGTFSFTNPHRKMVYICADEDAIVYVKGGNFGKPSTHAGKPSPIYTANKGKVIITGGTFGFDPTTWVADGYKAVKSGDKWYVVANDVTVAATLDDVKSVFANGGNIVLVDDIKFEKITPVETDKEVYLDLNGKTITVDENTTSNTLIWVKDGSKLTIDGNGTIDLGKVSTMAIFCPYGELVIENGTFIRDKVTTVTNATTGLFMGAKASGCNVTINGGYFDSGYYNADAADIDEILAGTKEFTETADDIAKRGKAGDANLVRVAVKDNVSGLLNHSGYGSFKVYGGTFVGANPAWGDEGTMLPKEPKYLRPWSYEQGGLLAGQVKYDDKIEIPAGYTITKSAHEDGRPIYTVEYNK